MDSRTEKLNVFRRDLEQFIAVLRCGWTKVAQIKSGENSTIAIRSTAAEIYKQLERIQASVLRETLEVGSSIYLWLLEKNIDIEELNREMNLVVLAVRDNRWDDDQKEVYALVVNKLENIKKKI